MDTLVDIHTHDATRSPGTLRLVCLEPDAKTAPPADASDKFCAGIHPWDATSPAAAEDFERIATWARNGAIAAIGESGLDRFRQPVDIPSQVAWFRKHIELSEETRLPLVIHSVKTDSDILAEHARARPRSPWILHACSANLPGLGQILSKGIHVSFGIREISRPDSGAILGRAYGPMFFLETDDSKTTLPQVYARAAELLGVTVTEIAALTIANWRKLFRG